jgi:hypothetical protein
MEKKIRIVLETKYFRFGYEKTITKSEPKQLPTPKEVKGATINLYA